MFFSKQRKNTLFSKVLYHLHQRSEVNLVYVLHCSYISTLYSQTGRPVSYSESKLTLASYLDQGHGTQKVVFH